MRSASKSIVNRKKIHYENHFNGCAVKCIQSASAFFGNGTKLWTARKSWHGIQWRNNDYLALDGWLNVFNEPRRCMHVVLEWQLFCNCQFFSAWSMDMFGIHIPVHFDQSKYMFIHKAMDHNNICSKGHRGIQISI